MNPRWRITMVAPISATLAVAIAAFGFFASRSDIIVLGIAPALWALWASRRPTDGAQISLEHRSHASEGVTETVIEVAARSGDAEAVQLALQLPGGRMRDLVVPASGATVRARSRLIHSGPAVLVRLTARVARADGALVSDPTARTDVPWIAAPRARPLERLPLPRRLTGLHGTHEGTKPGQGGDFRDLHLFAPGDEVRRVDWRATARLARRPDELYVRRMLTLSDAQVAIVVDTTVELGESIATWGSNDTERSGVTSLDRAREAGRSLAEKAVGDGDRVALHELSVGGRSVAMGAGRRHLARVVATISALSARRAPIDPTRLPALPPGAVVCVLSTFFDGAAARAALTWRAGGHRVIAIDTLPRTDDVRLTAAQRLAADIVFAERDAVFRDLSGAGIDIVRFGNDPERAGIDLLVAARSRA